MVSSTDVAGKELGCCIVLLELVITKTSYFVLDRIGHLGYNTIANIFLLQDFDKLVVEETSVGSETNTIEMGRNFG